MQFTGQIWRPGYKFFIKNTASHAESKEQGKKRGPFASPLFASWLKFVAQYPEEALIAGMAAKPGGIIYAGSKITRAEFNAGASAPGYIVHDLGVKFQILVRACITHRIFHIGIARGGNRLEIYEGRNFMAIFEFEAMREHEADRKCQDILICAICVHYIFPFRVML